MSMTPVNVQAVLAENRQRASSFGNARGAAAAKVRPTTRYPKQAASWSGKESRRSDVVPKRSFPLAAKPSAADGKPGRPAARPTGSSLPETRA